MRALSLLFTFILCIQFQTTPVTARPKQFAPLVYTLNLPPLPCGEVAFINGVNHKPQRAIRCSYILSDLAGGCNVYTIYNPTEGLLEDVRQCYFELYKCRAGTTVTKLHEKWDHFFSYADADAKFLQFCHSRGAIQVRNALMRYPPDLRKRIIVVAIAPGAYIEEIYCCRVYHYVSRRDIVPYFDTRGRKVCRNSIILLSPHEDAAFFDHHFLSPTYRPAIIHHLKEYILSGGGTSIEPRGL